MAQDPHFTQFYAAPSFLNPAFVGVERNSRITSIYRNQWSSLDRGFNTYNLAVDHNISDLHSGVGLSFTMDRQGVSNYKLNQIDLLYSYGIQIHDKWGLKTGVQFGWAQRSLNEEELIFGNQLDADFGFTGASSGEFQDLPTRNYLDVGTGVLLYSKNMWVGATLHHLNRPNQSFFVNGESIVPVKFSLHGLAKFTIVKGEYTNNKREYFLTPAFNYKIQDQFDQLDVGFYINHQPIVFGLWYRGIPLIKSADPRFFNHDAVAILVGYHYQDYLTLGYSYDLTISKLGPGTAGAHEISFGIDVDYPKKKEKPKYKYLPCPRF